METTTKKTGASLVSNLPAIRGRADQAVVELFKTRHAQRAPHRYRASGGNARALNDSAPSDSVEIRAPNQPRGSLQGIRDWEDAGGEWDPLGPGSGGWRA